MKALVVTLALLAFPAVRLAHGVSVIFVNDAASPIVLNPPNTGISLVAGLYGGTGSNSLTLETTAIVSEGNIPPTTVTLSGALAYFQVKVWDAAYATYEAALLAGSFVGVGEVFEMNFNGLGPFRTAPPSVYSSWHDGPIVASERVQTPVISNLQWTGSAFQFDLYGTVGASYYVEYTESFPATGWNSLTNLALPTSVFTIIDTNATGAHQRFYRAYGVQSQNVRARLWLTERGRPAGSRAARHFFEHLEPW